MENVDRIASTLFDVNLYNYEKTETNTIIEKVEVKDLEFPIEISFPATDSQNLTDFFKDYNELSNYKNRERLRKAEMVRKSRLSCVYWRQGTYWSPSVEF